MAPTGQANPKLLRASDSIRERRTVNRGQGSVEEVHLKRGDRAATAVRDKQAGSKPHFGGGDRRQREVPAARAFSTCGVGLEYFQCAVGGDCNSGRTIIAVGYVIIREKILLSERAGCVKR